MTHAQQLAAARDAVRQVASDSPLGELILIRDGHYAGHRFTFEDGYAVWFLDEQQVKIHWHDGSRSVAVRLVERDSRRVA